MPMHQPLTDTARKVLDQSQAEARALNQEFVGSEHLLLAILQVPGSQAIRMLRQHHVDKDALRTQLLSVLPYSEESPNITGALPLSPKVQRVVNQSLVMARSLRETKVSTRVLLLALLDEQGSTLIQCIKKVGADVEGLLQGLAEKPHDEEP
jgi:ATP-dependent Clp protease ATP-binding subunit ClpC